MTSSPDLSIIIPTFRREAMLLDAVHSALAVPGLQVEVWVLDDSPEGSARSVIEDLGDPRVTYLLHQPPTGGHPAVLRNRGAQLARAPLLYFLDDDDRALPQALAQACAQLSASSAGVLISAPQPFGDDAQRVEEERAYFEQAVAWLAQGPSALRVVARLLFGPALLVCSTCVIRRDAFLATGGFSTTMPVYEDIDFYMRAVRQAGYVALAEPVVARRVGGPSLISACTRPQMLAAYAESQGQYRRQRGWWEFMALKLWQRLGR